MRKEHKTAYAVAGYSSRTRLPDARSIPDEHSLHLALRGKNGVWQPLNFGIGVLFAEADFNTKDPAGPHDSCSIRLTFTAARTAASP